MLGILGTVLGGIGSIFGGGGIGGIVKDVVGGVKDVITHKRELKQQRQKVELELEKAKQKMVAKQETADIDWDLLQAKASAKSWKDEYWTIVLSLPAILAFIPGLDQYILDGFEALRQTPDWYKAAFGTAVAAAFGRNELMKWFKKK